MSAVRFPTDGEKLVQLIAFLASRDLPELTTMKLAKLVYFADKRHLLKFGRPITGDSYFCMKDGPVPSHTYDVLKGATGTSTTTDWLRVKRLFEKHIHVVPGSPYPEFKAIIEPDLEAFSDSDLAVLREVCEDLGRLSASALRHRAHQQPDFMEANVRRSAEDALSVPMPYESFLKGLPPDEAEKLLQVMQLEHADRCFAAEF